jgi:glutamate synthase domain-containing protein 2
MNKFKAKQILITDLILFNVSGYIWAMYDVKLLLYLFILSGILFFIILYDMFQTKHALLRNYPLIGRLRWVFEHERSKIQQYFIEDDKNGTPFNREKRSDIYQKSKNALNTVPFGTQLDVYKDGYEFIGHSMFPIAVDMVEIDRVVIGSKFCQAPYSASRLNISAMSFGALSKTAVESMNLGAKKGGFFQNTGEGGLSEYHLKGGDVCFQFGTGYFGAGKTINEERRFDEESFRNNARRPEVKLIEIKMSQGAKPGHGGILPASKNSEEIAEIRGIEPFTAVYSPPYHSAFHNQQDLLYFIKKVRSLSFGKPVGIKMCIGDVYEFRALIKLMKETQIYPDFITIDGGEGGTGAAPLTFSNHVGMPLVDAFMKADEILKDFGLRDEIKIIASGKISSSFDILKYLALGADMVNAARAFMLSLGCIQARECNNNSCPVGIATQDESLNRAIVPSLKSERVYNYHKNTLHEVQELMAAMGVKYISDLRKSHINVRKDSEIKNY